MSADKSSLRPAASTAPFSAYAGSPNPAAAPADCSITTPSPLLTSLATSIGTSATRRSPGNVSLTTATFITLLYNVICAVGPAPGRPELQRKAVECAGYHDCYPPQSWTARTGSV